MLAGRVCMTGGRLHRPPGTWLTVSATSAAAEGRYTVIVKELAQVHRVHSDHHASTKEALGWTGKARLAIGDEEAEITLWTPIR